MRLAGARRAQRSRSAAAWRVRRHASPGPHTRARWRRPHPIHFASAVRAGSAGSPALATRLRRRAHPRRIAWPIARRNGSRAPPPHTRRPTRIRRRCCAKQGREGDGESGGVWGVGGGEFEAGGVSDRSMRWHGSARRGQRRGTAPGAAATRRGAAGVPREQTHAQKKKKKLGRAAPRCGARACPIPSPSARRTCVRPTQPAAGRTSERFLMRGRSVARGGGTPRGGGGASGVPAPPQRARVRFAPAGVFFCFSLVKRGRMFEGKKLVDGGGGLGSGAAPAPWHELPDLGQVLLPLGRHVAPVHLAVVRVGVARAAAALRRGLGGVAHRC